jgi:hypothetical protein
MAPNVPATGEIELTCPHAEEVFNIARVDLMYKTYVNGQDRGC